MVLLTRIVLVHLMRHRGMSLRPINSVKNIVDSVLLGVTGGTITNVDVAVTVNDYTGTANEVPIGCKISSVYLFIQILPALGTANVDWFIAKAPNAVITALPVPGATGGTLERKYILHEEKGIPGNAGDGAYPLTFKGVIKIPKGRQRFGEGDRIRIRVRGADDYNACVKCIYKFYQ